MVEKDILTSVLETKVKECGELYLQKRFDSEDVVDELTNSVFSVAGHKHFFLFKQNLRRTNIQVAELISLVLKHSTLNYKTRLSAITPSRVDFTTFASVKEHVAAVIENVDFSHSEDQGLLVEELAYYFSNKILLEINYGSCSVFLPIHISTDVMRICGESGYIHSCGDLLLLRNATKATSDDFKDAVHTAVTLCDPDSKFMLIPYCHEDFSRSDRNKTPFLKNGLDDVKLHLSKAAVGGESLASVLDRACLQHDDDILLAPPGEYSDVPDIFEDRFYGAKRHTIWVLSDSDAVRGSHFPGEKKFYIVYLQRYYSVNILHEFEENKPGWASHTTLPHTLTGAMINISRPWAHNTTSVSLLDPFGGSGTTLLEASRIEEFDACASDLAPIYRYVNDANFRFFRLSSEEMARLVRRLKRLGRAPVGSVRLERPGKRTEGQWVAVALDIAQDWSEKTADDYLKLSESELEYGFEKIGKDLDKRILLFTALKALGRARGEIERGGMHAVEAFKGEIYSLIAAAERVQRQLEMEVLHETNVDSILHNSIPASLTLVKGDYSPGIRTSVPRPRMLIPEMDYKFNIHCVGSRDYASGAMATSYDVIVTDPPYGFNTKEDFWEMAREVRAWLRELIQSLKLSGGQLIMACPDVSYSGRAVIPFVRASFLAKEIVKVSAELGRECIRPALNLPVGAKSLGPPYYWIAEKTLRRKILHFWIREAPTLSGRP